MSSFKSDKAYTGHEKLVIAFDIGTTHSAVSYCYLYPGTHPEVKSVIRWPGQPDAAGDSKIPTLLAYKDGKAELCGAEALEAFEDDYELASWFKLNLHPDSMKLSDQPPAYGSNSSTPSQIEIPPLPNTISLSQIYQDFIKYLYSRTHTFFISNTPNGHAIWTRLEKKHMSLIFCTPNGWDLAQQTFLRDAAVAAGTMRPTEAHDRIEFVTEGEASVHYVLAHSTHKAWIEKGTVFAVVDAGGSTVDSNLYTCKDAEPLKLEEVRASECVQAGGVFVDRAARVLLQAKLQNSSFNDDESIESMVQAFEKKTKRVFDGTQPSNILSFGNARDNDREHGIIKGKLTLSKHEVAGTFDDTVTRTVDSCLRLLDGRDIQHLLVVGGFGGSPYLRKRIAAALQARKIDLITIDEPSKKAAADGSIIWYIKQLVKARAVRFTIGMHAGVTYHPSNSAHYARKHMVYTNLKCINRYSYTLILTRRRGHRRLRVFSPLVTKDQVIPDTFEISQSRKETWKAFPGTVGRKTTNIYIWERSGPAQWVVDEQGAYPFRPNTLSHELLPGMRRLCRISADLRDLVGSLKTKEGPEGRYWQLDFDVVLKFGGTQFRANLRWTDSNGVVHEGPATILPDSTLA
ncbi:hypothetical protein CPB86DRAFT_741905 [Serendipita vermifera]|nr:hypothetical protein CPB86DRAFT_741905 [Serendipita vermifera]